MMGQNNISSTTGFLKTPDQYFNDGKRIIDYILVYPKYKPNIRRVVFLSSLLEIGIALEEAQSLLDPNIIFIKVHLPQVLLYKYAEKYDIPLKCLQKNFIRAPIPRLKFMRTELTSQDPDNSPNYNRARNTLSGDQPKKALRYERSLVTYNILKRVVFGAHTSFDVGIDHLIEKEIFIAAYPQHDGSSLWSDNELHALNDRQLLRRYWSNPRNFFKAQPLDLIQKYFGDNIALYFAWLSFYNKMLLVPTVVGFFINIINFSFFGSNQISIQEACESNMVLCPTCPKCSVSNLKDSCFEYKLAYVTDNYYTIGFATFISFWGAIYMVLWKRRQAVLTLRWNIRDSNLEEQDVRPEFRHYAKNIRMSEFGEPELYISTFSQIWRKTVAMTCCFIMIAAVIYINMLEIVAGIYIGNKWQNIILTNAISAIIMVGNIILLRMIYDPIVMRLVSMEIPRTQTDFDNSYIIKVFLYSFINSYLALIYSAFFKGKFYTHPNDPAMYNSLFVLTTDVCNSSGCSSEVSILFAILMMLLPILSQLSSYTIANLLLWYYRKKEERAKIKHTNIPRWEKDFELNVCSSVYHLGLYEEMVIQFGFVTLFAFAFPMAPIFALVYNIIKIHIDAHTLVTKNRRPHAKRTGSIGAWQDIMACYVTFTSDFIPKNYYLTLKNGNLEGYVNFTLSAYVINTDHWPNADVPNGTVCWYSGFRNPPDHFIPYEFSYEHYYILAIRIAVILAFEHVIWLITSILSYSIPSIPTVVREKYAEETKELRRYLLSKPDMTSESTTVV